MAYIVWFYLKLFKNEKEDTVHWCKPPADKLAAHTSADLHLILFA
jgi:hypothetical protein